jgi:hypothetical protein
MTSSLLLHALVCLMQPTLYVCKSARRAGAMAAVVKALEEGWTGDRALDYAKQHNMTFLGVPAVVRTARQR